MVVVVGVVRRRAVEVVVHGGDRRWVDRAWPGREEQPKALAPPRFCRCVAEEETIAPRFPDRSDRVAIAGIRWPRGTRTIRAAKRTVALCRVVACARVRVFRQLGPNSKLNTAQTSMTLKRILNNGYYIFKVISEQYTITTTT